VDRCQWLLLTVKEDNWLAMLHRIAIYRSVSLVHGLAMLEAIMALWPYMGQHMYMCYMSLTVEHQTASILMRLYLWLTALPGS
jgi:hypothetical protein